MLSFNCWTLKVTYLRLPYEPEAEALPLFVTYMQISSCHARTASKNFDAHKPFAIDNHLKLFV